MESTSSDKKNQNLIYWIIIVALILFSLLGGTIGFQPYLAQMDEPSGLLRSFYRSLQLFTLENGDLDEPIPWILQVVRLTGRRVTTLKPGQKVY